MANAAPMTLRFWGTRGGVAAPGPDTVRYGGNTACIELTCGPHLLILDAGTGLRPLGDALTARGGPVEADILLSHTHLDHIIGLGFFAPLFRPDTVLRIHGGHLDRTGLRAALATSLSEPLMPNLFAAARARIDIRAHRPGASLALHPGLDVTLASLTHPGGSVGYRIDYGGRSLAFVTDTEHQPGVVDPVVVALARGADMLIYDANYTDAEFSSRRDWGHSTWQQGLRIAEAAAVGRLILFHHDASRTDPAIDAIAAAANRRRPGTIAAAEGDTWQV